MALVLSFGALVRCTHIFGVAKTSPMGLVLCKVMEKAGFYRFVEPFDLPVSLGKLNGCQIFNVEMLANRCKEF